jgi:hypothetical protein
MNKDAELQMAHIWPGSLFFFHIRFPADTGTATKIGSKIAYPTKKIPGKRNSAG